MKIYLGHATSFDYVNELYKPIRNNKYLEKYHIILPHEKENNYDINFYNEIDLFLAIVDYPSTGLGIELGICHERNIPIYCFYKETFSKSLNAIVNNDHIIKYNDIDDLINKIIIVIENNQ